MTKIIYHYHPETKEYIGSSEARRSPLDEDEVYLIPAFATETAPNLEENTISHFIEGAWVNQELVEEVEEEADPAEILKSKKTDKIAQIKTPRDSFMYADVLHKGSYFTNSLISGNNLIAEIALGDAQIDWMDSSGNGVSLTLGEAEELARSMKEKRKSGYFTEASLIAQINACESVEEVENLEIIFA